MNKLVRYLEKHKDHLITITIDDETVEKIKELAKKVIQAKKTEEHHQIDPNQEFKRFYTGFLGEAAVEKLLNAHIIDWSVGDSKKYNKADLEPLGLNIGVKTVEYGNFPVIHKQPLRPEIITICKSKREVIICGFASRDTLREYQSDSLIKSPNLRRRGTKTGFYGFRNLKQFQSVDDLKKLVEESELPTDGPISITVVNGQIKVVKES